MVMKRVLVPLPELSFQVFDAKCRSLCIWWHALIGRDVLMLFSQLCPNYCTSYQRLNAVIQSQNQTLKTINKTKSINKTIRERTREKPNYLFNTYKTN